MAEKPKNLWKYVDYKKYQVITYHIITNNYNNIFIILNNNF